MKLRRMIKQKARAALRGNHGRAVALLVIYIMVVLVINMIDAAALRLLGYEFTREALDVYTYSNDFFYNLPAIAVSAVTWIIRLVLIVPLGYGILNWHLELTERRKQGAMYIFWPYENKAALRGILLSLNIYVKMLVVSVVLFTLPIVIIFAGDTPDISSTLSMLLMYSGLVLMAVALFLLWVFANRFTMSHMLLCEKYQFTVHQAIKASVRFTKGHRLELIRFELSFLPWLLPLIAAGGMMSFSLMYDHYSIMPFMWVMLFLVVAIVTYFMLAPYYTLAQVMYVRYLYEYGLWQQDGAQPTATQEQIAEVAPEQETAPDESVYSDTDEVVTTEQYRTDPDSAQEQETQTELPPDDEQPPSNYL